MEAKTCFSKVAMHITQGCLVVPIQGELYDEFVLQIQNDVLEKVTETGIKGIIIDLSGVEVIDSFIGQAISDTARMASMLGATTVLTGFKPEVVVSLIDLGIELKDVQTAITLEEGFRRLQPIVAPEEMEEITEEREDSDDETIEDLEEPGEEPEEEPEEELEDGK